MGILNYLRVAKSEQWRLHWAFRTAISISCITFLSLYGPTKNYLIRGGRHPVGPAFAALVTGMAKDRTFDATLINCWSFVMSCCLSCFMCWVIVVIIDQKNSDTEVPNYILLCIIFILVFILQCMVLQPAAKKFACSIIPLLILSLNTSLSASEVWEFLIDAIIGAGCALIGNVLPLPVEHSITALHQRTVYCTHSSTALLLDVYRAWQYQSCFDPATTATTTIHNDSATATAGNSTESATSISPPGAIPRAKTLPSLNTVLHNNNIKENNSTKIYSEHNIELTNTTSNINNINTIPVTINSNLLRKKYTNNKKKENIYWRKLRLILIVIIYFKRNKSIYTGKNTWKSKNNSHSSKYLRMELIGYLRTGTSEIIHRNNESKFATCNINRRYLYIKYNEYILLLQYLLNIIIILDEKNIYMEYQPEYNYIYRYFHNIPMFRFTCLQYIQNICICIENINNYLIICDQQGLHPIKTPNKYIRSVLLNIKKLNEKKECFESIYSECRRFIYYEHYDTETGMYYTTSSGSSSSSSTNTSTTTSGTHSNTSTTVPPLTATVLMNMNSFLFLLDALSGLVSGFWSLEELQCIESWYIHQDSDDLTDTNTTRTSSSSSSSSSSNKIESAYLYYKTVLIALEELFPSQMPVFIGFLPHASVGKYNICMQRIRSALSVAVAMTLAAAYGVYLQRSQAFIAAFTIAFLAGGSAAGVTMITSLNRAAGTAVACVWAIIVQLILEQGGSGRRNHSETGEPTLQQQLIVGFAVVLLQFPATIVRSYPLQGYAGTCASFTICIMLLVPNLDSTAATDRIIDTFVGCVIYLAVEAVLSSTYSEGLMLGSMGRVFDGIDHRFLGFLRNFLIYKNKTEAISIHREEVHTSGVRIEELVLNTNDVSCIHSLRELHLAPMSAYIQSQSELLRYVGLEPGLSRPPSLPANLLAECVALQAGAVRHLQAMYWAVCACMQDVQLQDNATAENHTAVYRRLVSRGTGATTSTTTVSVSALQVSGPSGLPFRTATGPDALSTTTAIHPVLAPLATTLSEVNAYVAIVVSFLQKSLHDMTTHRPATTPLPGGKCTTASAGQNTLENLRKVNTRRIHTHKEFLSHFTEHISDPLQKQQHEQCSELENLEQLEAHSVIALFSKFQIILTRLLHQVVDCVGAPILINHQIVRTPRENKEIKIVCALIASTVDLVKSLKSLAEVVSRMRAHRDIYMTQTGKKFM